MLPTSGGAACAQRSANNRAGRRQKREAATTFDRQIPIRTLADWNEPAPGFWEVDFVAHGGDSMQEMFLWSPVTTDVCSGRTKVVPLMAREQFLVFEGLAVIRRQFPVPIRGIGTRYDSAFINEALHRYCQEQHLEFTCSRAHQKNDQARIEQKNGSVIRRFVGYRRLSGLVARQHCPSWHGSTAPSRDCQTLPIPLE
jgi:hypothetical protein